MKRKRVQSPAAQKKRFRLSKGVWLPVVVCGLLILFMVIVRFGALEIGRGKQERIQIPREWVTRLEHALQRTLADRHAAWRVTPRREEGKEVWHVRVPNNVPLPELHLAIQDSVRSRSAQILFAESDPVSKRVILHVGLMDSCLFILDLALETDAPPRKGRIAIIIDDFGDHWDDTHRAFLRLNGSLTYSIMPGRRWSRQTAEDMIRAGYEILLHLPMEPEDASFKEDDYTVTTRMDREAIRRVIRRALESVPGAAGVNNHMGSRATADRRVMGDVLEEVRRQNLYFVDSRTTAETVAFDVAQRLGVPSCERNVFLDAEMDKEAIRRSLWQTARTAERRGIGVAIGHCHRMMVEVLEEELPKLEAEGYRLVSVSEIVE